MTDWQTIFSGTSNATVQDFVNRNISGRQLLRSVRGEGRSRLSTAFRQRGTEGVRELARRALSRRS
jgi:hypothetical protein